MLKLVRMRALGMYGTQRSECREQRTRKLEILELATHYSESLELGMYGALKVWDSECMELRTQTVWSNVWNSELRTQTVWNSELRHVRLECGRCVWHEGGKSILWKLRRKLKCGFVEVCKNQGWLKCGTPLM